MTIQTDDKDLVSPDIVQKYKDRFYRINDADVSRYSKEALDWFRSMVSKDYASRKKLIDSNYGSKKATQGSQIIGKLYFFKYEAVQAGDEELGIYDQFPLIFIFNTSRSKEGKQLVHGINLHYITPKERQVLLEHLLKIRSSKRIRKNTRLKLSWQVIKAIAESNQYQSMVHTYRADRFKSRLVEIPAQDWGIVVFLQLQKWMPMKSTAIQYQSYYKRKMRQRGTKRMKAK